MTIALKHTLTMDATRIGTLNKKTLLALLAKPVSASIRAMTVAQLRSAILDVAGLTDDATPLTEEDDDLDLDTDTDTDTDTDDLVLPPGDDGAGMRTYPLMARHWALLNPDDDIDDNVKAECRVWSAAERLVWILHPDGLEPGRSLAARYRYAAQYGLRLNCTDDEASYVYQCIGGGRLTAKERSKLLKRADLTARLAVAGAKHHFRREKAEKAHPGILKTADEAQRGIISAARTAKLTAERAVAEGLGVKA